MERSDIELMLRAQDDDLAAFAQLTQRYRDPCAGSLPALLMDSSEADDCAQETLLRLWLLRREYKPTGKFSTYLFQIGKHHLLNQKRKLRSQASHAPVEEAQNIAASEQEQPEWIALRQDRDARLRAALTLLPPHLRSVMELRYTQRFTHADIARHLQIPVGTVKSRMSEATKRLRTAFAGI